MSYIPAPHQRRASNVIILPTIGAARLPTPGIPPATDLDRTRTAFFRALAAHLQNAPADAIQEVEGTRNALDQLRRLLTTADHQVPA